MSIFRRKLYDGLLAWKNRSKGTTAALIEGARRVGKSMIAEEFAKNEYKRYGRIDFAESNPDINDLFGDLSNLDRLFRGLQLYLNIEFVERDTAIIFDEVQMFPRAREAIKYLVRDGRYDYIETGSLISIKKNVQDIVIPSEEERFKLHPMDFEEFLWACGNDSLHILKENLDTLTPVNNRVHGHMMRLYREYVAVGGMPQAVKAFTDGKSYQEIDRVKRGIVHLYIDDLKKIDRTGTLGGYFLAVPSELSKESLRYRVGDTKRGARLTREMSAFSDIADSMTVELSYHVDDPRIGMISTLDMSFFKMFLEDTGLFVTLCFYDRDFSDNIIYEKLVKGRLPANLGYVYENAVAQALISSNYKLRYHTFPKEDRKHRYEIDFLIPRGMKICPIEVKSSYERSHVSLDVFMKKRKKDIDTAYVISTTNLRKENGIVYLPMYMAGFL